MQGHQRHAKNPAMITVRIMLIAVAWLVIFAPADAAEQINAIEAHEKAGAGEILLIDIRTVGEWKQTKIAASSIAISMHQADFLEKLGAAVSGDKSRKIALICATGGRSRWLQQELSRRGFTNVADVSEGMLGSPAGPGWLKRGLPVKPYAP